MKLFLRLSKANLMTRKKVTKHCVDDMSVVVEYLNVKHNVIALGAYFYGYKPNKVCDV